MRRNQRNSRDRVLRNVLEISERRELYVSDRNLRTIFREMNILRNQRRSLLGSMSGSNSGSPSNSDSPSVSSSFSVNRTKHHITTKLWKKNSDSQKTEAETAERIVLDFLHMSGLKDAARVFADESGLDEPHDTTGSIMDKIKIHLYKGEVEQVKSILDSMDLDILGTDIQLRLDLKIFEIRKNRFKTFSEFGAAIRGSLFLILQDIDNLDFSRILNSPYSLEPVEENQNVCKFINKLWNIKDSIKNLNFKWI